MSRIIDVCVCTVLAFLSSSLLRNVTAQNTLSLLQSMDTFKGVVQKLESKVELQIDQLNSFVTKAEMQENFENLKTKVNELKALLINSNVKEEEQMASLRKLEAQSKMQTALLDKASAIIKKQTYLINNFLTKEEMQANNLTNVDGNMTTVCDAVETLTDIQNFSSTQGIVEKIVAGSSGAGQRGAASPANSPGDSRFGSDQSLVETSVEGMHNLTRTNGIVEGIITGTDEGVVIITIDSGEQKKISSEETRGVAFNWQSRKVYWIEYQVGIKIADLDGSPAELLIADASDLRGLAVDQITGNLYYGVRGSNASIRVCDSMGKHCVSVASGVNNVGNSIYDIALSPLEGLMFWSSPGSKKIVNRANMDGTNATVKISEDTWGLYLDEFTEQLYWAHTNGQSIGHHKFNGYNWNVLLNTTYYPLDIAVDGDTLYFGGEYPNGVYSVSSNGKVSSIANRTGYVYHIALYGRNKVPSRGNPCQNSLCENLNIPASNEGSESGQNEF